MASINVLDLRSTGSDLFMDSESFLDVLDNSELDSIKGGWAFGLGVAMAAAFVYGFHKGRGL